LTNACTWLIRLHTAPYVSSSAALAIDATLACGAFGQSVTLVLEGPGVALLQPPEEPAVGGRNLFKLITSLPLYDIDRVYYLAENSSGITKTHINGLQITPVTNKGLASLIADSQHVLSF